MWHRYVEQICAQIGAAPLVPCDQRCYHCNVALDIILCGTSYDQVCCTSYDQRRTIDHEAQTGRYHIALISMPGIYDILVVRRVTTK